MNQDKLTHDERLRLECLAQANIGSWGLSVPRSMDEVIKRARGFEGFVRGDASPDEMVVIGSPRYYELMQKTLEEKNGT